MITQPKLAATHPDRLLSEEEGLEPAFQSLGDDAVKAGWSEEKTAAALLNLAVARTLSIEPETDIGGMVLRAKRSVLGIETRT